jgi:hypothetical protein
MHKAQGRRALTQTSDQTSKDKDQHPQPGAAFDDARIGTTGWDSDVVLSWGQENARTGDLRLTFGRGAYERRVEAVEQATEIANMHLKLP